jgi:hypothetical protein
MVSKSAFAAVFSLSLSKLRSEGFFNPISSSPLALRALLTFQRRTGKFMKEHFESSKKKKGNIEKELKAKPEKRRRWKMRSLDCWWW